jgi:hypothetical protein
MRIEDALSNLLLLADLKEFGARAQRRRRMHEGRKTKKKNDLIHANMRQSCKKG